MANKYVAPPTLAQCGEELRKYMEEVNRLLTFAPLRSQTWDTIHWNLNRARLCAENITAKLRTFEEGVEDGS